MEAHCKVTTHYLLLPTLYSLLCVSHFFLAKPKFSANLGLNPNNPTLSKRCKDHKEYHGYIWYYANDCELVENSTKYDFQEADDSRFDF